MSGDSKYENDKAENEFSNEGKKKLKSLEFLMSTNIILSKEDKLRNKQRLEFMLTDEYRTNFRQYNNHVREVEKNGKTLYYNPVNIGFLELKKREKGLSNNDIIKVMETSMGVSLSPITFSRKMRGESDFTSFEMLCIINILELEINEIIAAFNLIPSSLDESMPSPVVE